MDAFYKKHKYIAWTIGVLTMIGVFYQYVYKSGMLSSITNGMFGTSATSDSTDAANAAAQQQSSDDSAFSSFLQSLGAGSSSGSSTSSTSGTSSSSNTSSGSGSNPIMPVTVGNTTPVSAPNVVPSISVSGIAAALQQNAASVPGNSSSGINLNVPGNALGGGTVYGGGQSASWAAG